MYSEYIRNLYEQLVINKYEPIRGLSDGVIDDSTEVMGFINHYGSAWYALIAINTKLVKPHMFQDSLMPRFNHYFEQVLQNSGKKNIVVLYLFISDEPSDYGEFLEEDLFQFDRPVVNAYWEMNLYDGSLRIARNNPDKIADLKEIVINSVDLQRPDEGKVVFSRELYESAAKNRPKLRAVGGQAPYATYVIIILNLLVAAIIESRDGGLYNAMRLGGHVPELIRQGQFYRLITSIFIHFDFMHLANNCVGLYIFGSRVEKYFGRWKFIAIYLLSGIAGGLLSLVFVDAISAGASGGVFGLLGAVVALTGRSRSEASGISYAVMAFLALTSLGMGFLRTGINNFAHAGGLAAGILLGFLFYKSQGGKESGDEHRSIKQ